MYAGLEKSSGDYIAVMDVDFTGSSGAVSANVSGFRKR